MDQNLVRNPNEPFGWHNIFRPKKNRAMTGPVSQNLAGKSGLPNQLNRRSGSGTTRPRINLLRLNSQGEDSRSPPIVPYECNFHRKKKSFNIPPRPTCISVDCASSSVEFPSPPTRRRLHNMLTVHNFLEDIMQKNMFQKDSLQSSSSNNLSCKFLNFAQQIPAFLPSENKRGEFLSSPSPLTRGLPYLRPTVPVGLSASAILFGRYQQAERSIDKNNLTSVNKNKFNMCTSSSSLLLARSELEKLISGQKLTVNQHLPQQKQVTNTRPDIQNITATNSISDNNMKTKNMEHKIYDTQDNKRDHEKKSEISVVNVESCDGQTETKNNSFISSEDSDHSNEDSISDVESENDEDEDSSSGSDTSGSISDFEESDTESYDSSSESDTGFDSDAESWSSDVKDSVPTCQNAIISFILGQSVDAAGGKDSGLDEIDEPLIKDLDQVDDHVWHSLNASEDPYNPINGWKCSSGSPFQTTTPVSESQHNAKGQLKSSNCALPKIHSDVEKSNHLVSTDIISNEDIHLCLCKPYSDVPINPNKNKLNNGVDEIKSENKCAANIINIVNNTKSCFKNKLSRHQQKFPKKVSFSCKDVSSIAYENPEWCDDYREMRKPYWESFARDRCRFQRRIKEIGDIISYCFDSDHRRKMIEKINMNS